MKFLSVIIVGFLLIGQSCSIEDKNFVQIIDSPQKFHNQEIQVSGIYHEQFEDVAIYLGNHINTAEAMWIDLPRSHENLHGQKITVKGRFDMTDKGHLEQYIGTIKEAEIVED